MPWDDGIDWNPGDPLYTDPVYDDPYESGYLGGDADGSTGSPTNPDTPGFDWSQLGNWPGGGASEGGSSSSMSGLMSLLRSLGLTGGAGGADSLLPLLSLLLSGGGLLNSNNANDKAVEQLQHGAEKANQLSTDLIGGARGNFTPYINAGHAALPQLQGMVGNSNLADKFVSKGPQSNITLAQLAKR